MEPAEPSLFPDDALPPGPATGGGSLDGADLWARTLAELQARKPLQAGFANQGVYLEMRGTEMVVGFAPSAQMAKDSLNRPAATSAVEEILNALSGESITLKLETRSDLTPPPAPPKPELPPRPAPAPKTDTPKPPRKGKATAPAGTPAPEPAASPAAIPMIPEEEFYNDPLIAAALQEFEATITSITPAPKPAT